MTEKCAVCDDPRPGYSVEPDDGTEVLSCHLHLADVIASLFDGRLASGELKVYDVRGT